MVTPEPMDPSRGRGRPETPLADDSGPTGVFATALRDLRQRAGNPTYRTLGRRARLSPSALSEAARGSRLPTWRVAEAYILACGGDPEEFRERWQAAHDSSRTPRPAAEARERIQIDSPATARDKPAALSTAWIRRHGRAIAAIAATVVLSIVVAAVWTSIRPGRDTASSLASHSPQPARRPAASPAEVRGAPTGPYPIRRYGDVMLRAGERISLDTASGKPWQIGTAGSWPPYDLEFTLADRLLVSVGTDTTGSSLAWIKHPTDNYEDCTTSDYAGVVPTRGIASGTEFCVLTGDRRRALATVDAVERDPATGLPVAVTLSLTVWDHIVPPGS